MTAQPYSQIRSLFPQEAALLIDRLLGDELREKTLIYPVLRREQNTFEVITLIQPEESEADTEGQHMVCVNSLSRAGADGYDGYFGTEEDCNQWVEDSVQHGAFTPLAQAPEAAVAEGLLRIMNGCPAHEVIR